MEGKELGELSSIGIEQKNEFGDRYFSNLNFNSFYQLRAYDLYERDFKGLFKKNNLYIIVGTDSGIFPLYIKQKGFPDGSRYLFIEPASILSQLRKAGALDLAEPQFAFADEANWLEAIEQFNGSNYFYLNAVSLHYAYCTKEDSIKQYTELAWFINEKITQLNYEYTATIGTEQFTVQQIMNLVDNQISAVHLKDCFNGKTAFVLGGGPSLDEALPWLLVNRDKVVILAVSRICKRLLELGLEPDFLFSGDPFPVNFAVSKAMYNLSAKPILIHSNYVFHPLISQWTGRSFYLDARSPWQSSLNEDNFHAEPPTVSNTAIAVALKMGFSTIYLAGIDLCFTKDGFTHAQGSNEHAAGARFNLSGAEVLCYDETMSPTGLDYYYARDLLEQQVQEVAAGRLFNISLGAAKITNIAYIPLSELRLDAETLDVEAIVAPLFNQYQDPQYFHQLQQELTKASYQFQKINKLAARALKYNDELYSDDGRIKDLQLKQKLDKLERQLDKKHYEFSQIVKALGLKKFMQFIKPHEEVKQAMTTTERVELAQELKARLDLYYGCYLEGSRNLIELLELANKILLARAEEKKTSPNWDLIIEACRVEHAYGRVYLWESLESAQQLSAAQRAVFSEFKEKFQKNLHSLQADHLQLVKQGTDLSFLNQRAASLFKYKKKDALNNMLLALDKHNEPLQVVPYRFLIQAYLAELDGHSEHALQLYQAVLEQGGGPLQEALLRILHLDYQVDANQGLGLLALECLSQLDVRYQVFYAEGLRIKGRNTEAIQEYVKYLTVFPEDWQASLNLAELFYQQKIYEGADLLLKQVLAKHPEQKSALLLQKKLNAF